MPLLIAFACDRFLSFVVADMYADVLLYAVIGDFPAMERERATRGTNRGSPRGIPRKTRSHQDSWMLALCCTDLTYWPLQLPCTINRDPARGTSEREREREKTKKRYREGDVASHVVAHRAIFPSSFSFSHYSTRRFHGWFLSFSFRLFLSFRSRALGKTRRSLKWKII